MRHRIFRNRAPCGRGALPRDRHFPTGTTLAVGRNKLQSSRMESRHPGDALGRLARCKMPFTRYFKYRNM